MQEYVQKSISTTLPRRPSRVSGGELSQDVAPSSAGSEPSTGRPPGADLLSNPAVGFASTGRRIAPIKDCSIRFVLASDNRVNTLLSNPNAIAATAINTATPSPRRTHSPAPSPLFNAPNTRPPARSAMANEAAAPAAYPNSSNVVCAFGPEIAAPVRTNPRIGPAHGAQSSPVATPIKSGRAIPVSAGEAAGEPLPAVSLFPSAMNGRASKSARWRDSSVNANTVRSTSATTRPY